MTLVTVNNVESLIRSTNRAVAMTKVDNATFLKSKFITEKNKSSLNDNSPHAIHNKDQSRLKNDLGSPRPLRTRRHSLESASQFRRTWLEGSDVTASSPPTTTDRLTTQVSSNNNDTTPNTARRRIIFSWLHEQSSASATSTSGPSQKDGSEEIIQSSLINEYRRQESTLTLRASLFSRPHLTQNLKYNNNNNVPPLYKKTLTSPARSILRKRSSFLSSATSSESLKCHDVKFDPRIWVHEYEPNVKQSIDDLWYGQVDLRRFEFETIKCIREYTLRRPGCVMAASTKNKPFYCHPALGIADEEEEKETNSRLHKTIVATIRNVLIVDPNKLFLLLFTKSIKSMMPHVQITTAQSSQEALKKINKAKSSVRSVANGIPTHGFDLIIAEEHLCAKQNLNQWPTKDECQKHSCDAPVLPMSGSELLCKLASEQKTTRDDIHPRYSFLIGVSKNIEEDGLVLEEAGADMVWGKPPPSMNNVLRDAILEAVLAKRGNRNDDQ